MHLSITESLGAIEAAEWNRLQGPDCNPFLRHEFLYGLEKLDCSTPRHGWKPQHLILRESERHDATLIGAVPLYIKAHSWGEYVFDWALTRAWNDAGMRYYPKLISAVPFTPVTGPRILVRPGPDQEQIRESLVQGAIDHARQLGVSSLHWLFTDDNDTDLLEKSGLLRRTGMQYHWSNQGYSSFDDFLASLSSKKRKNIKRERRLVRESGVDITIKFGAEMDDRDWHTFYEFYLSTITAHGAIPYLNEEFFRHLGEHMPEQCCVVFARNDEKLVAGALFLKGSDALYGRYWGSLEQYDSLHFELCYYQAIDYCIRNDLQRFEAGAQGGHKLSRGLVAVPTWSAHWIAHEEFREAVQRYLQADSEGVASEIEWLETRSPFKRPE